MFPGFKPKARLPLAVYLHKTKELPWYVVVSDILYWYATNCFSFRFDDLFFVRIHACKVLVVC
jgi:hypothetical protein